MSDFDFDSSAFILNPRYQYQWEEAQQCNVLLYPEGLIKLSGSAAEIIQRCQEKITFSQLIDKLKLAFPEADGIAEDVKEFLQDAQRQDWIVESAD
jgi:pyrroloquinoline quinone biosynthesis protein D